MKLNRPHLLLWVFDGGERAGRASGQAETRRQVCGFVAVGHPDGKLPGQAKKKAGIIFDIDLSMTVLALGGGEDLASEQVNHQLESVTDAEHGKAEVEHAA